MEKDRRETPDVIGALATPPPSQLEKTLGHYRKHGAPPSHVFEDGDLGPMTRPIDPEPRHSWPNNS